jgi:hypothetical protein
MGKTCLECSEVLAIDAIFCSKCGIKQHATDEIPQIMEPQKAFKREYLDDLTLNKENTWKEAVGVIALILLLVVGIMKYSNSHPSSQTLKVVTNSDQSSVSTELSAIDCSKLGKNRSFNEISACGESSDANSASEPNPSNSKEPTVKAQPSFPSSGQYITFSEATDIGCTGYTYGDAPLLLLNPEGNAIGRFIKTSNILVFPDAARFGNGCAVQVSIPNIKGMVTVHIPQQNYGSIEWVLNPGEISSKLLILCFTWCPAGGIPNTNGY